MKTPLAQRIRDALRTHEAPWYLETLVQIREAITETTGLETLVKINNGISLHIRLPGTESEQVILRFLTREAEKLVLGMKGTKVLVGEGDDVGEAAIKALEDALPTITTYRVLHHG